MNVTASDMGYREIDRMADFMKAVSKYGLWDDVAVSFSYNHRDDEAYCTTENGEIVTMSDFSEREA